MEHAGYTLTDPPSLEEIFAQLLLGTTCGVALQRLDDGNRQIVAGRADVLLAEDLEAMELVGRLANSIAIGCDDAIDVAKMGSVIMTMARRARFYREVRECAMKAPVAVRG